MSNFALPNNAVQSSSSLQQLTPGIAPGKAATGLENQEAKESLLPPVEQAQSTYKAVNHEDKLTLSSQEAPAAHDHAQKSTISAEQQYIDAGNKKDKPIENGSGAINNTDYGALPHHNTENVVALKQSQQEHFAEKEVVHDNVQQQAVETQQENNERFEQTVQAPQVAVPSSGDPEIRLQALEAIQKSAQPAATATPEVELAAADAAKKASAIRAEIEVQEKERKAEVHAEQDAAKEVEATAVTGQEKKADVDIEEPRIFPEGKVDDTALAQEQLAETKFDFQTNSKVLEHYQNNQHSSFDLQKVVNQMV